MNVDLTTVAGWKYLSKDFCNKPTRILTVWEDGAWLGEPVAVMLFCGRLSKHEGDCDHAPPMEDVISDIEIWQP